MAVVRSLLFNKPIAAVRVVVDSVLLLQILDMPERSSCVRSNPLVRMGCRDTDLFLVSLSATRR